MKAQPLAVLGFGRTGQAVLDFILARQKDLPLYLYNDDPIGDKELQRRYEQQGVRFLVGGVHFPELERMHTLIISPGMDGCAERFSPLRRKGIEIISEIELASRCIRAPIVAVTGTNGKSTTVSLVHHLLARSGRDCVLAGNIGVPLISQVKGISPQSVVVLELSSFQLEEIVRFRPKLAVLLNITPDHLDRYPNLDAYREAKLNLFRNQGRRDSAVLNADDPLLREAWEQRGGEFLGRIFWFSREREVARGAYLEGDFLILRTGPRRQRLSLAANPLKGIHNLENILAAVLTVSLLGVRPEEAEAALASFQGLPHRMEHVATINGAEFINDSKATNVDAALKSISSFNGNLVVILGGKDKGGDFSLLAEPLRQRVEKILLIGKAAPTIARQLECLRDRFIFVRDLQEAVTKGYEALPGQGKNGVVLLAPACASFDMFDNFEHRGDVFRQEVLRLQRQVNDG